MSRLAVQSKHPITKQTFYDLTSLSHAPSPQPLSLIPLPPHHPHTEVLHFDTIEEANEFRERAHEIRLKYRPGLNVMHRQTYVTRDDLQSFQSILANEITKIRSGIALKRCHVRIERCPYVKCGPPKLYDCPLWQKGTNTVPCCSQINPVSTVHRVLEFILGLKHTELLQFFVIIGKEGLGLSAAAELRS